MTPSAPMRVEALVERAAARWPDRPGLVYDERRWTYAQLRDEMARRAATLRASGLPPGAVVGLSAPNSDDSLLAFLAAARAGYTHLYVPPRLADAEVRNLFAQAQPQLLLTAEGRPHPSAPETPALPLALAGGTPGATPEIPARATGGGEALLALLPSSGTTGGLPKLVRVPHRQFTWRHALPRWWEDDTRVLYNSLVLQFSLRGFCDALAFGMTFVQASTTDFRRVESEMARHEVTILRTVPAFLHGLLAQSHPPPAGLRLTFVRTGAAALSPEQAARATARYGAATLQEYSSTEGGALLGTPQEDAPPESVGTLYAGIEARLVDGDGGDVPEGATGELIVRSPGLSLGYLDNPTATALTLRDGWLWTGDLARRDGAGRYFLQGRRALRISVGGHMVSPEEVEAVLLRHPGVREVVVLGAPDERRGEAVRAVIVPSGAPPPIGELQRFCRAQLAGYKVPRRWDFRAELPRSGLGKVLRHLL